MVIKGRSRGNGVQLADYLLNNIENDRAQLLDVVRGTSRPNDLKKSLLEMSLSSELTKGVHGLYHAQINPAIGEDHPMSPDDWQRAADILEQHLGFEGQKRAIVLHEKKGRIHGHIVWERYDHETGILKNDGQNYKKHDQARAEIERELGHEITAQQRDRTKEPDHKQELTKLWNDTRDGRSFVKEAEKSGYQIAYSDDRRPWRVVTPDGHSLDLVRQLDNAKNKDVRDRLQPIRDELKPEAEALAMARERAGQKEKTHEITDPWELGELANKMLQSQRQKNKQQESEKEPQTDYFKRHSYSFRIEQPLQQAPALPLVLEPKKESDKSHELSDSQDLAAAMIERHKQKIERDRVQEMKQQGDSMTEKMVRLLEEAKRRREQQQHDRNKDLGLDI